MSKLGKRLIKAAQEAREIVKDSPATLELTRESQRHFWSILAQIAQHDETQCHATIQVHPDTSDHTINVLRDQGYNPQRYYGEHARLIQDQYNRIQASDRREQERKWNEK